MQLFRVILFLWRISLLFLVLDSCHGQSIITFLPKEQELFPTIRANVSSLKTRIIAQSTEQTLKLCLLNCAMHRFCVAINYKKNVNGGNETNCQLTNTTEHRFDESTDEKDRVWTFRKVKVNRRLLESCRGDVNECHNGGTPIWDPLKTFSCLCKEGYRGQLCEKGPPLRTSHLNTDILKNEPPSFVQDLSEWLPQEGNWSVCWKATRDGWNVRNFHSHCDNWEPTLTIVKVMKNNKTLIFGGYATKSWAHKDYISAPGSFMFSLRNNDDHLPFKAPLKDDNNEHAIFRRSDFGPTFGKGRDLRISNKAASNTNSYTNFGHSYKAPPGYRGNRNNTRSLLAGSYHFTPSEIEVLYLN